MTKAETVEVHPDAVDLAQEAVEEPSPKKARTQNTLVTSVAAMQQDDQFHEHFTDRELDNLRVSTIKALVYPQLLIEEVPLTASGKQTVLKARKIVTDILHGRDDRVIVIVGPCSIHDVDAAREYATRLKTEADRLSDDLLIVMRVYFEKPRTTVGWKGLINDPYIDETFKVNKGLRISRKLLSDINDIGVPCGCEFLDTMTPQYIADLVSWAAIGARTTECQLHRELASGLSMPVGFKNSTSGDCDVAVDAVISATHSHCFFSMNKQGTASIVHSKGNQDAHVILRGGKSGPNYDRGSVAAVKKKLWTKEGIGKSLVLDCSHGNSNKDYKNQPKVLKAICEELLESTDLDLATAVCGVMIESHLFEGKQNPPLIPARNAAGPIGQTYEGQKDACFEALKDLRYGVSITDGCVSWLTTVEMLQNLASSVRQRRANCAKPAMNGNH